LGRTTVDVDGDRFWINGRPTYPGCRFRGHRIEGLLLNARMVQGVFDDLNPTTRSMFDCQDGPFDAERNTSEFVAAMASWQSAGLLAFTVNFQGGSPRATPANSPGTIPPSRMMGGSGPITPHGCTGSSHAPTNSGWS
jgi:hypothetical protein